VSARSSLILGSWSVGARRDEPSPRPGTALVSVGADGAVIGAHGIPTAFDERRAVRYQVMVDITRRRSHLDLSLPARDGQFQAVVDVDWHVHQPWMVVRRQITDANELLQRRMHTLLGDVSREFGIAQISPAEEAINSRFGFTPRELPEGLRIYRCFVLLTDPTPATAWTPSPAPAEPPPSFGSFPP
jgi:hypothetical protein